MEFLLENGANVGVGSINGEGNSCPRNRVSENRNGGEKAFCGGEGGV